jgi:hypothetical protein
MLVIHFISNIKQHQDLYHILTKWYIMYITCVPSACSKAKAWMQFQSSVNGRPPSRRSLERLLALPLLVRFSNNWYLFRLSKDRCPNCWHRSGRQTREQTAWRGSLWRRRRSAPRGRTIRATGPNGPRPGAGAAPPLHTSRRSAPRAGRSTIERRVFFSTKNPRTRPGRDPVEGESSKG